MQTVDTMANLPNLGPKSQQMLAGAGIHTLADLRALGSVAAYVQVQRSGARVSLNLLWALEGAITGLHWQEVARDHRTSLLLALEDCEREKKLQGRNQHHETGSAIETPQAL